MPILFQDLRYAARTLWKSPGFTVVAVLCLALGIGVNTAVFSIVNTLLLRPLPFADPDRLLAVYAAQPQQGVEQGALSAADLVDLRSQACTLAGIGGMRGGGFNLAGGSEPVRVQGSFVTQDLFPLLGAAPLLGRNFVPAEGHTGGEPVIILGHDLWQNRFNARPDIVGQTLEVSGVSRVVVGVMPPGFRFPESSDLWIPLRPDPTESRSAHSISAVARLRTGATVEQARTELAAIARRLAAAHPETNTGWTLRVQPYRDGVLDSRKRASLGLMLGAVGFVLLIACANVANLLLSRAVARRREMAVRLALGAGRGRIVRQLLTESVLVAVAGGVLGALVAVWWLDWLVSRVSVEIPYWVSFGTDGRVLLYTLGISVLTGLIFGTIPALRASRTDLQSSLKEGARGTSGGLHRSRLRSALVAGQLALSLVLLVGATLLIRSFLATRQADVGFETDGVLTMRTSIAGDQYEAVHSRAAFYSELVRRLETLPGVRRAAVTAALPVDVDGVGASVIAEGQPRGQGEALMARHVGVLPGIFAALGTPLLAGRDFTENEAADSTATVAIISRSLADRLWPGDDPVGQRMQLGVIDEPHWFTVVGVAPDLHYKDVGQEGTRWRLQVHVPYARMPWRLMSVLVRTDGDAGTLAPAIRREIRALDGTLPVFAVHTARELIAESNWDRRVFGEVFGSFALMALLLAVFGVYGVMAYAVNQRTHEIGVRVALGARRQDVLRLVVGKGASLVAAGAGFGLLGAVGLTRLMRSLLWGVGPVDPVAFVGIPLLLAGAALLASYLPARRAARVDPMVALRSE